MIGEVVLLLLFLFLRNHQNQTTRRREIHEIHHFGDRCFA